MTTAAGTLRTLVVAAAGPFDRAVVWVHGHAPEAAGVVAEHVTGDYLHVLGSASADPSRQHDPHLALRGHAGYRQVVLGFHLSPSGSRWLTDAEISAGVLGALRSGSPRSVVGTVEPWVARP